MERGRDRGEALAAVQGDLPLLAILVAGRHSVADQAKRPALGVLEQRVFGQAQHEALDRGFGTPAAGLIECLVRDYFAIELQLEAPLLAIVLRGEAREPRRIHKDGKAVLAAPRLLREL